VAKQNYNNQKAELYLAVVSIVFHETYIHDEMIETWRCWLMMWLT